MRFPGWIERNVCLVAMEILESNPITDRWYTPALPSVSPSS